MLRLPISVWLAAALVALLLAGCEKHTPWLYPACANLDPLTQVNEPANPLYYPDVQEIVDGNCVGCHTAGGIAPFPLTTYDDVAAESGPMRTDVVAGIMPPFLPDPCCGQYLHNIQLNDTQIATIAAWIDH